MRRTDGPEMQPFLDSASEDQVLALRDLGSWLLEVCLGASKLSLPSIPITTSRKFVPDRGPIEFLRRIILPQAA